MSKKYSKEFNDYMEKYNELGSLDYVSREFLSLMRQKCYNCNRNRVECAFQPHCEERKYMNVMIDMKINLNDLPAFCYSQQIRNLTDYLNGKAFLIEPKDYKVFLSDFIKILNIKPKSDHKKKEILLKDIIEKIQALKGKTYFQKEEDTRNYSMFIADGIIYHVNFEKEIVTINLHDFVVSTEEELSDIIYLYSQYFNIEIEIIKEIAGLWYLKAGIPSKGLKSENIINEYREKIEEFSEYVDFFQETDKVFLLIDIKTPLNQKWKIKKFSISKISNIFKLLNELSKKIT